MKSGKWTIQDIPEWKQRGDSLLGNGSIPGDDPLSVSFREVFDLLEQQRQAEHPILIPLVDVSDEMLARLPHTIFVELFFSLPRKEALTREKWNELTRELENIWGIQEELALCGTTARTLQARFLEEWELKEMVYRLAGRLAEQARASVDWHALSLTQQHTSHDELRAQARHQALHHPAAQELQRRGVALFE